MVFLLEALHGWSDEFTVEGLDSAFSHEPSRVSDVLATHAGLLQAYQRAMRATMSGASVFIAVICRVIQVSNTPRQNRAHLVERKLTVYTVSNGST